MPTVIIDPGHGGMDPGAVYKGRQEKDDNLRLALAVGELLSQNGVDVLYTRTDDVYDSPYRKAMIANESGADYLISFHRNASPIAGNASGIETLVYADRGLAAQMARDINRELAALGFRDIGVIERPGLAVLRRSRMPAVLIEHGKVWRQVYCQIEEKASVHFDCCWSFQADKRLMRLNQAAGPHS